ncbi:MAG: hypothetical protein JW937_05735 [Candidatus Omnitrophica bacterium]|nr:hypothetical protein [Candidatus Omnitrophota bacterium]
MSSNSQSLRLALRVTAIISVFWCISHWFFPVAYHRFMGFGSYPADSGFTLLATYLIAALALGYAYGAWKAAADPAGHRTVIHMLLIGGFSSFGVFLFQAIRAGLPAPEWITIAVLGVCSLWVLLSSRGA